jgi:hypothetical protein
MAIIKNHAKRRNFMLANVGRGGGLSCPHQRRRHDKPENFVKIETIGPHDNSMTHFYPQ